MSIKYRPEIDGLRALAVGAVLVYHAQFSVFGQNPLPGGFLGVDIFFVISGYLITSIILRELNSNGFSVLEFYHRRARRILPALFAVLLFSLVCGWFLLTPDALASFSGSGLSALFFGANIWFWLEDSYWAAPGALKPLLHTWTLAVEEQFYIFFPLLVMFLWRFAKGQILTSFLLIFGGSLILSQIGSKAFADASFYLLPMRAWELLAGSVLAKLELTRDKSTANNLEKWAPPFGLLLVIGSFFLFNETTPHPSFLTLVPIAGVCSIIWWARGGEIVTRVLSSKPFVFIGLISYSLYLWHYPILAYVRVTYGDLSNSTALLLMPLICVVSYFSYRFIEQPFRRRDVLKTKIFVPVAVGSFAVLCGSTSFLYFTNGYAARYGELAEFFTGSGAEVMNEASDNCLSGAPDSDCENAPATDAGNILVIGDSHAGVLKRAAEKLALKYGYSIDRRNLGSCAHLYVERVLFGECDAYRAESFEIIENAPPSIILYTLHWRKYRDETMPGKYSGTVRQYPGETMKDAYRKTFGTWTEKGHRVLIILPGIESEEHMQERIKKLIDKVPDAKRDEFMNNLALEVDYDLQLERDGIERSNLQEVLALDGIIGVDPLDVFCDRKSKKCALNDGKVLYIKDYTHHSPEGIDLIMADAEKKMIEKGWLPKQ